MTAFSPALGRTAAVRPDTPSTAGQDTRFFLDETAPGDGDGTIVSAPWFNAVSAALRQLAAAGGAELDDANENLLVEGVLGIVRSLLAAAPWTGDAVARGSLVTFGGGLWYALRDVAAGLAPSRDAPSDWQLLVEGVAPATATGARIVVKTTAVTDADEAVFHFAAGHGVTVGMLCEQPGALVPVTEVTATTVRIATALTTKIGAGKPVAFIGAAGMGVVKPDQVSTMVTAGGALRALGFDATFRGKDASIVSRSGVRPHKKARGARVPSSTGIGGNPDDPMHVGYDTTFDQPVVYGKPNTRPRSLYDLLRDMGANAEGYRSRKTPFANRPDLISLLKANDLVVLSRPRYYVDGTIPAGLLTGKTILVVTPSGKSAIVQTGPTSTTLDLTGATDLTIIGQLKISYRDWSAAATPAVKVGTGAKRIDIDQLVIERAGIGLQVTGALERIGIGTLSLGDCASIGLDVVGDKVGGNPAQDIRIGRINYRGTATEGLRTSKDVATAAATATIALKNTTGVYANMKAYGLNILDGTTVLSVNAGAATVTLSAAPTAAIPADTTLTFGLQLGCTVIRLEDYSSDISIGSARIIGGGRALQTLSAGVGGPQQPARLRIRDLIASGQTLECIRLEDGSDVEIVDFKLSGGAGRAIYATTGYLGRLRLRGGVITGFADAAVKWSATSALDSVLDDITYWGNCITGSDKNAIQIDAGADNLTIRGGIAGRSPDWVAASGTGTFADNPADGQALAIDGVALVFKASASSRLHVQIATTLAGTLANLMAMLDQVPRWRLRQNSYALAGTVLTITRKVTGTAGNAVTLSTTTTAALSGATLAGGVGTPTETGSIHLSGAAHRNIRIEGHDVQTLPIVNDTTTMGVDIVRCPGYLAPDRPSLPVAVRGAVANGAYSIGRFMAGRFAILGVSLGLSAGSCNVDILLDGEAITTASIAASAARGVRRASVVDPSAGYTVGQGMNVVGGTRTVAANLKAVAVGPAGELLTLGVNTPGLYTALPANPAAVAVGAATVMLEWATGADTLFSIPYFIDASRGGIDVSLQVSGASGAADLTGALLIADLGL
ncbi:hypothetical protein [Labrys wisconsinensis]|uniref:Uncharacterized protein n=1 Tax=Labrys wisconsinensis TaxID=425677 RepID=A0ABU0JHD3_9HYPH|nr:hypothetical protein [Labrys wisconsinensis]MDQ0472828.1 hypothetical protein [Labrys wisconsinensis]